MSPTAPARIHVIDDPLFDQHRSRGYHPERPERLGAARRALDRCAAVGVELLRLPARDAAEAELAQVHDEGYLAELGRLAGHYAALDADTYLGPPSVAAARRAAGGAIALTEALLQEGSPSVGAALLRPPGHHATRDQGMGFCLLNNVAVAAAWALGQGLGRVAVVDWDVHHGNGTQDIFWTDPRVLYVSLHEWPLYPGSGSREETGEGEGKGTTVNVPLSEGATNAVYRAAFEEVVLPVLERFSPELLLVSAGFDAHERDPLSGMRVTEAGYGWMAEALGRAARSTAKGRVGLLLEGGYDLTAVEASLEASLHGALRGVSGEAGARALPEELGARHREEIAAARRAAGV